MTLNVIDAGKKFGSMNIGSISYNNLTVKDKVHLIENYGANVLDLRDIELTMAIKKELFDEHRRRLGIEYGFDGNLMFMADQQKKDGSYFEITEDYVRANPNGWSDIPEDILIITDKVPGVVIGHPVADCRVVMITDLKKGATAIAHCSAELVDKKMPMMIADALQKAYDSKDEDLYAYICSGAGPSWGYDSYPSWAKDRKLWDKAIRQDEDGIFRIDMKKVIENELRERNISMLSSSSVDTLTNSEYFSNSMASPNGGNDPSKAGRNFQGAFYGYFIRKSK